ncbi:MAG TPA: double-strand break repair protein AddB [Stellaceae bacterium]|nr:double-strand break repair protein AddB [Stellaceae bacterium]
MTEARASVVTIEAHLPFLDTLAERLRAMAGDDPLALSRMTVLLPTRRACRSLAEAFLRAGNGEPLLLPRLKPVGDLDLAELAFLPDEADAEGLDLPPAIPELDRQLQLAARIQTWDSDIPAGQAAMLARALARFLDEAQTEGAAFEQLAALVPEDYATHWQDVLKFLRIVTEHWPGILTERGALDPADRRNRLLAAQAARWKASPPSDPVIAAGLTGGIPAVAALMEVVARLPTGTVVLPGLDRTASPEGGDAIRGDPGHPQHLMTRFLDRLEIQPATVEAWQSKAMAAGPPERMALIGDALLPARLTEQWRQSRSYAPAATEGLRQLDCAGPQEEAQVIALLLRHHLERRDGSTAALVTPDRALARRVAAELHRWNIEIDDSAGVPLNKTPPGVFLRLVLDLVSEAAAPVPLLAALKHPLAAGGLAPEDFRAELRALERAALRGVRPAQGLDGILQALKPEVRPRHESFVERLRRRLAPLVTAMASADLSLGALVEVHIAAAEALAESAHQPGDRRLWSGDAGEIASTFMSDLLAAAGNFTLRAGADYPALFESLLAELVVRPRFGRHPRLFIWGLLEARLQRADLMILGGLNEGTWPGEPADDPWMSRPMRRSFGVAPPERRIGVAAHDFVQCCGAPEVVLTRASRVAGTPTLPSRWLLRLETVLRAAGREGALIHERQPLMWQWALDRGLERVATAAPAPRPPIGARPRRLSVTAIETWMRDPYAIYARYILRLKALEPLDAEPEARERGVLIHQALDEFVSAFPRALPADAEAQLLALGRAAFGPLLSRPGIWAFWWPRFERIAGWFLDQERERRHTLAALVSETNGSRVFPAPGGDFELNAKADRIERRADGLVIVDYKTGTVPRESAVKRGLAPQLPLEAAIAEAGGFANVPAASVAALEYWRLSGLAVPGELKCIAEGAEARALIGTALAGLQNLVAWFDDPATPYRAVPVARNAPRYSDYEHLERVKEWRATEVVDEI